MAEFEKRANDPAPDHWARQSRAGRDLSAGRPRRRRDAPYENAIAERPKEPAPVLALAQLARDRGDVPAAQRHLERALPLVPPQDREQTLRALVIGLLDLKNFDVAKAYHRELVKQSQNSLLVRGEFGRELDDPRRIRARRKEFRELVDRGIG